MKQFRFFIFTILTLTIWATLVYAQGQFTVQIESATTQAAADGRVRQLKARGLEAYWVKSDIPGVGLRYRVRIGKFPSRAAAMTYGSKLKQQGVISDFFTPGYESPEVVADAPKKVTTAPPPQNVTKPAQLPSPAASVPKPPRAEPTDNASPKPTPAVKPRLNTSPTLPLDRPRRMRDTVAEVVPASSADEKPTLKAAADEKPLAKNKPAPVVAAAEDSGADDTSSDFARYRDLAFGYSFDYPRHWDGGKLSDDELQAQRIDGGVVFKARQGAAFMNATWNRLKGANSQSYDNGKIVDLIVESLGSGGGFQGLTETGRQVVNKAGQVITYIDLRTMLSQPNAPAPLEFVGKAVIIRSSEGILLIVTFYSKNSDPSIVDSVERIISSAQVPQ
ncbi:MAG TPA: SPOR domain-containing protein [Blastocatellia bacterium]|nr:SPOR domain-containing protein [Blastocatellia bacterium]